MIVLVDDDDVGVLARFADAGEDALCVFGHRSVGSSARQILAGLVVAIAGFDPQLVDAGMVGRRAATCGDEP